MSNRIYFDRNRHPGWFLRAESSEGGIYDNTEAIADRTLVEAGLMEIGNFSTGGGYRFSDPLRAAAVLRLAGFEVLPWE